jgi:hypothetical protein
MESNDLYKGLGWCNVSKMFAQQRRPPMLTPDELEVLNEVRALLRRHDYKFEHEELRALITRLQNPWIKVSERLPECPKIKPADRSWVVYRLNSGIGTSTLHPANWAELDNGITHWADFQPAPPKEGE